MLEPRTRCRSLAIPAENPETLYAGLDFETANGVHHGATTLRRIVFYRSRLILRIRLPSTEATQTKACLKALTLL